ncbi:cell division protein ZapE [Rickettsiella endosymbiont of Dermanyssus gallinae]|uniref:cell division protein ZapE n=1 Tax=Rickettsiella endosymbiont of Dermanyssus gallinae TaxID=2856608 RepID=UPI001C528938|nr:cell division protein ZapE [Rickettsiella endosymbiont of Dermanyssus gallinae]
MTPLQAYTQKVQEKTLSYDPRQEMAMQQLQQIYTALLSARKWRLFKKQKTCQGLYLWGEVGRGKTYLMDLFYNHLPVPKMRLNFYQFMQSIHTELTRLQGQSNPLDKIAHDLARKTQVICLDEFLVHEIGDAMLLSQLLQSLFKQGIMLVTTANMPPDALYQHGLQRELFLPAITQLKQHLTIFHLETCRDYRLYQDIEKNNSLDNPTLVMPLSHVQHLFDDLARGKTIHHQSLSVHGRLINHKGYTDNTIWFDFASICAIPRSQVDYLNIAKRFSTVLISQLTPMDEHNDNSARLFIHLVDVFYDAGIQLIVTSATTIDDLYPQGRFLFEFKRTKSRLMAFQKEALKLINEKKGI